MTESDPRTVLNSLIETCQDGERGLLHAAELVTSPALKTFFTAIACRRAQFAAELLPHAQHLGGAQTADGTAGATLHRKWMEVRSALSAVEGALPATVRDLVERGYDDVRASHLRFADFNGVAQ